MAIDVKICGLRTRADVEAAVAGGARYIGFVFFPPSPRAVTPAQAAALGAGLPVTALRVGLLVDPTDDDLAAAGAARLDMLQLHGSETVERTAAVRARVGLPVIKAIAVAGAADLERARAYESVADLLLFDARPPKDASRPGGNAVSFDWTLLRRRAWRLPWLLAGGLRRDNLKEAIAASGAAAVDVSSGVEDAEGVKSAEKIHALLALAAALDPPSRPLDPDGRARAVAEGKAITQ